MANRSPNKVIRECDAILEGELEQTPEQFQRWVVVQIKKLAIQSNARHAEGARIRYKLNEVDRFSKGGL